MPFLFLLSLPFSLPLSFSHPPILSRCMWYVSHLPTPNSYYLNLNPPSLPKFPVTLSLIIFGSEYSPANNIK